MSKIAVFGVMRNESKLLPLWIKYYGKIFGEENLFIYDDDSTEEYDVGSVNYEKVYLKRERKIKAERFGVGDYSTLWNFVTEKYRELFKNYEYIVHADADDFIVANPDRYTDLKEFIEKNPKKWFRCTAYEVLQMRNEKSLDWSKNLMSQRENWIRVSNLDKTSISNITLDLNGKYSWVYGNHYVVGYKNEVPDPDLLLIHLHRIDLENYEKKYLVNDPRITNNKDFMTAYGGYPLFWNRTEMIDCFYNPHLNDRFEGHHAPIEKIPLKYKGVF